MLDAAESRLWASSSSWDVRFSVHEAESDALNGDLVLSPGIDGRVFFAREQASLETNVRWDPHRSTTWLTFSPSEVRREGARPASIRRTPAGGIGARLVRFIRMGVTADAFDLDAGEPPSFAEGAVRGVRVREEEQLLPMLRIDELVSCARTAEGESLQRELPSLGQLTPMQRVDFETRVGDAWRPATLWFHEGFPVRREQKVRIGGEEVGVVEDYDWRSFDDP